MNAQNEGPTAMAVDRGPELGSEQLNPSTGVRQSVGKRPDIDEDAVRRTFEVLMSEKSTFEVRALVFDGRRETWLSGYFKDPEIAAGALVDGVRGKQTRGVYVTLNPVHDALHARCADRLDEGKKGHLTSDGHIVRRTRLLIDIDAERPSGISSTAGEHAAALHLAEEIEDELASRGWPMPIRGDSGNGAHLVYGIDLPAKDDGLVERVLAAAQARFGCTTGTGVTLKVDTSVANPARISKVYGTVVRKGDNTKERPHRTAKLLKWPNAIQVASRELLEAFALEYAPAPASTSTSTAASASSSQRFDVGQWLSRHGVAAQRQDSEGGRVVWVLDVCPFNADHNRGEAHVHQEASGKIGAACKHESCKWGWQELRARFDAAYSQRLQGPVATRVEPSALAQKPPSARLVAAADIEELRADWLWQGRVPLGMLTFLDGDPGLGKSTLTAYFAARVSRGEAMPGGSSSTTPSDVILIASEDVPAITTKPRLRAAGADLTRVRFVEAMPTKRDPDAPPSLAPELLYQLDEAIARCNASLVIIDPITNYLPSDVDSHRDQDVRRVLSPLASIAEKRRAAILVVRHLRKSSGSALHRGSGSIGMAGAARSILFAAVDPANKDKRILAHSKCNVGRLADALRWHIADENGVGVVRWDGVAEGITADDLAIVPEVGGAVNSELDGIDLVCSTLRELLAGREPQLSKEVERDVQQLTGASKRTIERARKQMKDELTLKKIGAAWYLAMSSEANTANWPEPSDGGGVESRRSPKAPTQQGFPAHWQDRHDEDRHDD